MPDNWTLTWTDLTGGNVRPLSKNFDKETDFASGARDRLNDLRASKVAAVLPDGTKPDEQALRDKFMN